MAGTNTSLEPFARIAAVLSRIRNPEAAKRHHKRLNAGIAELEALGQNEATFEETVNGARFDLKKAIRAGRGMATEVCDLGLYAYTSSEIERLRRLARGSGTKADLTFARRFCASMAKR